jgi:hypothetical protein
MTHRVLGVKVHDARLVSIMLVTKVSSVMTLNVIIVAAATP